MELCMTIRCCVSEQSTLSMTGVWSCEEKMTNLVIVWCRAPLASAGLVW